MKTYLNLKSTKKGVDSLEIFADNSFSPKKEKLVLKITNMSFMLRPWLTLHNT